MGTGGATELDIDAYARIVAELAADAADQAERAAILSRHDLDEARWDAIDDAWQARLSQAIDESRPEEGVPELVAAYGAAVARAQAERAAAGPVVALETFARTMGLLRRDGNTARVLATMGLTLDEFLRANQYWTPRITREPDLAAQFARFAG